MRGGRAMNEIIYQKSYREYKEELDGVLQRTAEGFVQIGYLLKVARDTNILEESGYKSVAEFAEAEYNLNKTQVSRFISINDKFSEGGYSDHLLPNYQGYGYAKLTIMLQLPDSINEELSPSFSKAEIQAVKDELDEEQRVSDLERYIEGSNERETNLESVDEKSAMLYKTILQLGEDEPELYVTISERKNEDLSTVLPEVMASAGDKMYSVRVKGVGRMMISISDMSEYVKLINSRTGEKESYTWADVAAGWAYAGVLGLATEEQSGIECWEQRYERKYPITEKEIVKTKKELKVVKAPNEFKKPKVAPVQQESVPKNEENVSKEVKSETIPGEIVHVNEVSVQDIEPIIPGQTSIENDFPEYMPEPISEPEVVAGVVEEEKKEENVINTESDKQSRLRGYKAAVTSNLNRLVMLWEGVNDNKISIMLDVVDDLKWRLNQIKESEDEQ